MLRLSINFCQFSRALAIEPNELRRANSFLNDNLDANISRYKTLWNINIRNNLMRG